MFVTHFVTTFNLYIYMCVCVCVCVCVGERDRHVLSQLTSIPFVVVIHEF